jgi:hypothetical protein
VIVIVSVMPIDSPGPWSDVVASGVDVGDIVVLVATAIASIGISATDVVADVPEDEVVATLRSESSAHAATSPRMSTTTTADLMS